MGIWTILLLSFVTATLYFGREILIPLALAGLLAFLLSPLVAKIERWIGRIAGVLVVVLLLVIVLGAIGFGLARQLVDVATKLPDYKTNMEARLHAFKMPGGTRFQ